MKENLYQNAGSNLNSIFRSTYGYYPQLIVKAPGRINIIGEHTDYNFGFVLPAAINYYINAALAKNGTNTCNVYAVDFDQKYQFSLNEISESRIQWLNYILGVTSQLSDKVEGFDMAFTGNIPRGAGLSSSAAICCATVMGLSYLFDLHLEKWAMAKIAQKSEHDFAHVNCGIMDQFACVFGKEKNALLLNCLTLEYEEVPIELGDFQFVLINSNVPHDLYDSPYNERRSESEGAIVRIKKEESVIESYQDLTIDILNEYKVDIGDVAYRRAKHIIFENDRLHQFVEALSRGDRHNAGRLLSESHFSAKVDYEITCIQTDFLVEGLNKMEAVLGARQVGGGFGGCILALAKASDVNEILLTLRSEYKNKFGLELDNIPIQISKGCHRIQ